MEKPKKMTQENFADLVGILYKLYDDELEIALKRVEIFDRK